MTFNSIIYDYIFFNTKRFYLYVLCPPLSLYTPFYYLNFSYPSDRCGARLDLSSAEAIFKARLVGQNLPDVLQNRIFRDRLVGQNLPDVLQNRIFKARLVGQNLPDVLQNRIFIDRIVGQNLPDVLQNRIFELEQLDRIQNRIFIDRIVGQNLEQDI